MWVILKSLLSKVFLPSALDMNIMEPRYMDIQSFATMQFTKRALAALPQLISCHG